MMIKKLARSAAGEDAPLPQDVRSPAALRRTLDYLIDSVLGEDDNLAAQHEFLWDRTRAIRRDFVFQSSMSPPELADQQSWNFGDCAKLGMEVLGESEQIKIAVGLVECLQTIWSVRGPLQPFTVLNVAENAFSRFFTILKGRNVSYTMACFAEMHFNEVRKNALKTILSAYQRQRDQPKDWTIGKLNQYLQFDDPWDIVEFGESYGLRFDEVDDVIDTTVYEEVSQDANQADESSSDEGLFVKDNIGGMKSLPPATIFAEPSKAPEFPAAQTAPQVAFSGSPAASLFGSLSTSQTNTAQPITAPFLADKPKDTINSTTLFAQSAALPAAAPLAPASPFADTSTNLLPSPKPTEPPKFIWPSENRASLNMPQIAPKETPKFNWPSDNAGIPTMPQKTTIESPIPPQPTEIKTFTPQAPMPEFSRPKLNDWSASSKPVPQPFFPGSGSAAVND
ncbi:hypothetical protein DID88_006514 [Monilinia fructigena]|uniref:SAC3/GANP/THP3 conserved domain-containing protein n=1 Tax=Monilinia fructigena TaxID=38457 RepID=A0A395IH36_9HELO|nr:hypothetical protein DID88_006514 [Monilinia fructigena]